jgi:hypothetical protein
MTGAFATVCDFGKHTTVRMAFVEAAFLVGFGLGKSNKKINCKNVKEFVFSSKIIPRRG